MEPTPLSAEEFSETIKAEPFATILREAERPVAVAVSGGPDSMALAALVSEWGAAEGRGAAHAVIVDHGLRPESFQEAQLVMARLSAFPGLLPRLLSWDGDKPATGIMEKARAARYGLLTEYCKNQGIRGLFLAHHQDDQAETFLIRLAKGSGLDGLSGMSPVREEGDIALLRPFLGVSKARLVATCRARGIPFVEDPSNANPAYLRPRLRAAREILEKEGLESKRLAQTAARLARARGALDFYARQACEAVVRFQNSEHISVNYEIMETYPEEIRLRVILILLSKLDPGFQARSIRMERLEPLVTSLFSSDSFPRRTLGGFVFSRHARRGEILIEREKKNKTGKFLLEI